MNGTWYRTFVGLRSTSGRFGVSALALLGAALMQPAHADQISTTNLPPEQSIFFLGSESMVLSGNTGSAGTVTVDVTDFEWPVALQSLSFSAASESQVLKTASQSNPGTDFTISFSVGGPGAFFAQVAAIAGASQIAGFPSIGDFSVSMSFLPSQVTVPLPPAVWLFGAGLLGLAVAVRVRRRGLQVLQPLAPTTVC